MRLMIEWTGPSPHYRPVGVWVENGVELVVAFAEPVPSGDHARSVAAHMRRADAIAPDFLAHHEHSLAPQMGDRGPIYETSRYKTPSEAAAAGVEFIRAHWDNDARRWKVDPETLT
jgi:hypothetical protein